jgi:hypothetical protein
MPEARYRLGLLARNPAIGLQSPYSVQIQTLHAALNFARGMKPRLHEFRDMEAPDSASIRNPRDKEGASQNTDGNDCGKKIMQHVCSPD